MKKLSIISTITIILILIVQLSFAQSAGDYRTKDSGKWTGKKVWQVFNGTNWVNTNSSPDDPNVNVTILHLIELHTTGNAPGYSVKNITINSAGKLYRKKQQINQAKSLKLYGDIVCDGILGNGTTTDRLDLDILGSNCIISGSGECKLNRITKSGTGTSDLTINMDIELYIVSTEGDAINNTSSSTLNITINPTINLTSHSNINLLNCNLNVKCNTSSEYGSLITYSVSNSTLNNTIVERYITENDWHYISSPVDDANTVIFLDTYLKWFNEPDSVWKYIINADSVLATDMQGYAMWSSAQLLGNTTLEFKGALNAGSKNLSLTNTQTAGHGSKGFNFAGNPYTSALDWDYTGVNGWTKTNVDDAIYIWNSIYGSYGSYINGVSTNDVTNIIPAQQAFFVHCNSLTGLLGANFGAQVHDHKPFLKSGVQSNTNSIRFITEGNGYRDEAVLNRNASSTELFDGNYDAYKLMGLLEAPQIFSISGTGDYLSINSSPGWENTSVKLGFKAGIPGIYSIRWEGIDELEQDLDIFLEDILTGSFTKLNTNTEYQFNHELNQGDHRFNLHFELPNNISDIEPSIANIYSSGNYIYLQLFEMENADVAVYNILGQEVLSQTVNGRGEHKFYLNQDGYYIVNVITNNFNKTIKVFIK